MPITLKQQPIISEGDIELLAVDASEWLDSDELLTGDPTVDEITTTDLTITNKKVSVTDLVILDRTVQTGKAVQCFVSGQQAGTTYQLRVVCNTDASRKFTRDILFDVV